MVSSGRFLSPLEKDKRSSVLEYASAEKTKKSKKELVHEKIIFLRIGTLPLDKIVSVLQYAVERAVGLFHYNLTVLFDLNKSMM